GDGHRATQGCSINWTGNHNSRRNNVMIEDTHIHWGGRSLVASGIAGDRTQGMRAVRSRSRIPAERVRRTGIFRSKVVSIQEELDPYDADIVGRGGFQGSGSLDGSSACWGRHRYCRRGIVYRNRHVRLNLGLRQRAAVNPNLVEETREILSAQD